MPNSPPLQNVTFPRQTENYLPLCSEYVEISKLPFAISVTLGQLLNFSVPQFPRLINAAANTLQPTALLRGRGT